MSFFFLDFHYPSRNVIQSLDVTNITTPQVRLLHLGAAYSPMLQPGTVAHCQWYGCTSPTLCYGYGLELVQFSQQTGALRRMKAINELLGPPGRVQGLHGLLHRVCAQVTPLHQYGLWGEPCRGCYGGCLVVAESGCSQLSAGSQGEGGPQDSPQAGQHLWAGG